MSATDIEPSSMMLQSFLQLAVNVEVPTSWPTIEETLLFLVICVFFLLLNAFFVASEFAIVKVRGSQIDMESGKTRNAEQAKSIVGNLDGYLSANQLGITIASLALAIFAEPYIDKVLRYLFLNRFDTWFGWDLSAWGDIVTSASHAMTLMFFTVFHVVIGELIPKTIAIRKPLPVTLAVAKPLHLFYVIFKPLIWVLNGMANLILKHVLRVAPVSEGEHVHSAEELALLVAESGAQQEVTDTEREILINALALNDLYVRDVMTPRSDVVALDVDDPFAKNLDIAARTMHTRFPLVKGHLDNALGLVHIKDLLRFNSTDNPDLMSIKRELKVVPETMPLDVLLKFFLKEHAHLAMVVDEFGDPSGLVFLDNVMEELVGDIHDEFDSEESQFTRVNDQEFVVEGSITLNELSDHEPEVDIESGEVTTVGGYITQQMGRIPEPGETLDILGYEAKVTSTDGRRVGQVHFRKIAEAESSEGAEEEVA